jgi:prepilin-type N-terminal cleavage/methylation domain-containing protein
MTKKDIFQNSGFTLLEIIVVIFIITIGLLGILSLGNQNVQVQSINRNSVIASQLAQEGLEQVRNKRDMNWLQGADWETSSSSGSHLDILQVAGSYTYTVDAYTGSIKTVSGIADPLAKLYINNGGFYTHAVNATSTPFSRIITVSHENNLASTSVNCLVQWKRGTNTYSFTAQTVLYNWK